MRKNNPNCIQHHGEKKYLAPFKLKEIPHMCLRKSINTVIYSEVLLETVR